MIIFYGQLPNREDEFKLRVLQFVYNTLKELNATLSKPFHFELKHTNRNVYNTEIPHSLFELYIRVFVLFCKEDFSILLKMDGFYREILEINASLTKPMLFIIRIK